MSKNTLAGVNYLALNIAMTWLSYPGRTNATAKAEEVRFAVPGGAQ